MAFLPEKSIWEDGIYQLETSDPVLAGPDGIDNLQGKQLANRTVYLKDQVEQLASGKQPAGNAAKLSAARKIEATGDGSWNVIFDGSRDVSGQLTLRDSGVAPGSYGMVTVDGKGRVTAGRQMTGNDVPAHDWSKVAGRPTTLAGYGIIDASPLTASLAGSTGVVSDANSASAGLSYFGPAAANVPAAGPGTLLTTAAQNGISLQLAFSTSGALSARFYDGSSWSGWTSYTSVASFIGSFSSGSLTIPGGSSIKIGTAIASSTGTISVTFAIAFPNFCAGVIAIPTMGSAFVVSPSGWTKTGFSLDSWGVYNTAALGVRGAASVIYVAFGG
ncbi:gp53-like domain-containing protein [Chromobacterium piscinae]|uniref:gp53-like domain-containing protein n=1 Tax=Chromobacterium piscinae TaxID=686831 RepID=UPI003F81784B